MTEILQFYYHDFGKIAAAVAVAVAVVVVVVGNVITKAL